MSDLPQFVPGIDLSRALYHEGVAPIMARVVPAIPYAAALIGHGSDVFGYDTARSMDHDWGPRLIIMVREEDADASAPVIEGALRESLPEQVMGYPTRFVRFDDEPSVRLATAEDGGSLRHRVRITTLPDVLEEHLGIRDATDIDASFWLTVTEQQLLEITSGAVFRDDIGELTSIRAKLAWYPDDLWRYRMAAGWMRIGQIEPFVGRTGELEDDAGSRLIAAGLVRDVMLLSMLQERAYAPYAKWLGTAFARTEASTSLSPLLDAALAATDWRTREAALVEAYVVLANRHNALGLTPVIDPLPRPFHTRPFTVIDGERYANALMESVADPAVRALPRFLGGIDQFMDSTDALVGGELRQALRNWMRNR